MSTTEDPPEDAFEASPEEVPSILSQIRFRIVSPTDIPNCYEIEKSSYPPDEAASKSSLQYRQHHAAPYFRCAVLGDEDDEIVIGFVCSTRCREFTHETMTLHEPSGPLLAIHSVVVKDDYRNQGIAMAMMKDYVAAIKCMNDGVEKLVLISKGALLGFYVQCGFTVTQPSDIEHGAEQWYDLEMNVRLDKSRLQGHPCWIVDSFAEESGKGNPAAVVLLPSGDCDEEWMQLAAREFNLSETAFVWPHTDEEDDAVEVDESAEEEEGQQVSYGIRFFTCDGTEVDLCGHATLASAAVLFQTLPLKVKNDAAILFHSNKDILMACPYAEGTKTWMRNGRSMKITMNFPKKSLKDITSPGDRSAILSMLKSAFHMADTAENILYLGLDEDGGDILVELTREYFLNLGYDNIHYSALMEWDGYSRGVILCCRESQPEGEELEEGAMTVDFLSRFFGPKAGIPEDPVTGSAHCTLGPYFSSKLAKSVVVGCQKSIRGGMVQCVVHDDRVDIIGSAVTTVSGSLCI